MLKLMQRLCFGKWWWESNFFPSASYPAVLKFVNPDTTNLMLHFPEDMNQVSTEINRLDNQVLVRYFEEEWGEYEG
jgi:spermidine synthase